MGADVIFWGIFISLVGLIFLRYGKKTSDGLSIVTGIVLMIYPYFITSLWLSITIGLVICAVFFLLKRIL